MTNETAERKTETGPLPPLPGAPLTPPNRRPPGPWRWVALAAGLALVAVIAGLLLIRPDPLSDPKPVETVQGFVGALEARDATKMLSYVEPSVLKKQIGPEVRTYVEYIREVRFEGARYELIESDGERARVRLTATMHYTIDYGEAHSGERAIDATYDLRKTEGTWYLSGVALPKTNP